MELESLSKEKFFSPAPKMGIPLKTYVRPREGYQVLFEEIAKNTCQ